MRAIKTLMLVIVILIASGCSRLQPPPQISPGEIKATPFRGADFKYLHRGDSDRGEYAALVYMNNNANFRLYKQVIIEPVAIWGKLNDDFDGMSKAEIQALAKAAYTSLKEQLSKDYLVVEKPAPWTMRIRVALTRAEESDPGLDFVSTVIPFGRAAAEAQNLVVGKTPFVGSAAVELKITDAMNGELIAAAVDERYGKKRIEKGFDSQADVKYLFDYWAKALRYRLCVKAGHSLCEVP